MAGKESRRARARRPAGEMSSGSCTRMWGRSSGGDACLSPGVDLWSQVERRRRPEWRKGSGGLWEGVRMLDWEAADLVCS